MKYNAYIVYSEYESIRNKFFIDCFFLESKKKQISMQLLIEENISIRINNNKLKIYYNNNEIEKSDFVIMRCVNYELTKQFELLGIKVFNNSNVSLIANNKYLSYQFASSVGVNVLNTELVTNKIFDNCDNYNDYPYVIKPLSEKGGKDVYLINNKNDLLNITNFSYKKFIKQQVSKEIGKDLRVYVLGKKIIKSILRYSENNFLSNYCINGTAKIYELNDKECSIVNKIINNLDADFIGIDFLFDNDEIVFNEIEDVVGCRMLYKYTNINIVELYLDYIINKLNR